MRQRQADCLSAGALPVRAGEESEVLVDPVQRVLTNAANVVLVVVYHVTIVAIGHGLVKKFQPLVIGCVLRTAGSSMISMLVVILTWGQKRYEPMCKM